MLTKHRLQTASAPFLPVQTKVKTGEEQNKEECFRQLMSAALNCPQHFVSTSGLVFLGFFHIVLLSDSVKFHIFLVSSEQN